jgi:hypothetical protein
MTRDLTLVLPFFCNVGMLDEQARVWASYPADLRRHLHVVVVDDCSPKGDRLTPLHVAGLHAVGLGSVRVFRLLEKKRWNWLACRNLGAKVAGTDWLLLTDIDHVVPVSTLERVLRGELHARNAYRFKRVTATRPWPYTPEDCTAYKAHNDSWLMTRALFFDDKVGGYDERLSGCYGTSGEFKDRVMAAARAHVILDEVLVRYPREIVADASTPPSVYTRKDDPVNDNDLRRRKEQRATIHGWRPLHGLIPFEEVYSTAEACA